MTIFGGVLRNVILVVYVHLYRYYSIFHEVDV